MSLDIDEVNTSEDLLGYVFNERSIFPIIPGGAFAFLESNERKEKWLACITNRCRT